MAQAELRETRSGQPVTAAAAAEADLELERRATVEGVVRVACGWCQSIDVNYAEDVVRLHPIIRVDREGELIVMDDEPLTVESGQGTNARVFCMACGKFSRLPDEYATVFE